MSQYREPGGGPPIVVLAFGGRVIAVHAHHGKRLWEHNTGKGGYCDRISISGTRVYALCKSVLVCLDYETGREHWTVVVPAAVEGPSATLLAHGGSVVAAGAGEAAAYSADGELLWHDGFKGYGMSSVAIAVPGASAQVDRTG